MSKATLTLEMPPNCWECPISHFEKYLPTCPITGNYHNNMQNRPEWCPLEESPEDKTNI